ncbi:DUF1501 domain-containing protein [Roseiconus nitratireducens]|uniref:DUF1501 domain-containing protein n=1 Tax=Roseiconus nitratireducens TaxID=2605748 RepID=A0A5M6CZS6_9BACT|nr:DUF1501 domain-containing protein [Roseiconus nitratireducens]KAA5540731.1 DUF1501 domain-containing protein [Roseiconus nitratireducens]
MKQQHRNDYQPCDRRSMLKSAACGFGGLAAAGLANQVANAGATHFTPKAKRVIFLFMHGGVSQMDSFDRKPTLNEQHGNPLPYALPGLIRPDRLGKVFGTDWKWKRHGDCGQWVTELFPHTAKIVDKLCFIKSMHTEGEAHGQAVLRLHTGEAAFDRPSVGSWVSYGLGNENENLPAFVALDYPPMHGGVRLYGSSFLPAEHQAMQIKLRTTPDKVAEIRNLHSDLLSESRQREQVDAIVELSRQHAVHDPNIEGVIRSFELAYRMQSIAPEILDLGQESKATLAMYGVGDQPCDGYARQCLLARRMAEAGVRFIQVATDYHWDHHGNIEKDLPQSAAKTDKPVAALINDLDRRGLLDDTLVVWAGEFGRTPVSQIDRGAPGRDHNPHGFTIWMAGGGVRPGYSHGETNDFGYLAVEKKVHMHDLHATILHLLGLDHERLTYRYAGRDFRLTDVYGNVVHEVIA